MKKIKIIIAGGGTGGHLFPGVAIAEKFLQKNSQNEVLFVNTGNQLERRVLKSLNFNFETLKIEGIKGRKFFVKIRATLKIPKAFIKSFLILRRYKPDVVIGMGSYSSGPIILVAYLLRIKTAICEQNIFPGITNRVLSKIVNRVYLSFENTKSLKHLKKSIISGNPVRYDIFEASERKKEFKKEDIKVFVIGGSQGASSVNKAVLESIKHLNNNYFFIHQTGINDEEFVKSEYKKLGFKSEVKAFFDNVAEIYSKVDLVIARAGATTISEIIVFGIPTIFIPYPFASDNHQFFNAKALLDAGAAMIILEKELSKKPLWEAIKSITEDEEEYFKMKRNFNNIKKGNAACIIVSDVYQLLS